MAIGGGNLGNASIAVTANIGGVIEQLGAVSAALTKMGEAGTITERALAALAAKNQDANAKIAQQAEEAAARVQAAAQKQVESARLIANAQSFGVQPVSAFEQQLRGQTIALSAMREEANNANERVGILGKTIGGFKDLFSGGSNAIAGAGASLGSFGLIAAGIATGSGFLLAQALGTIAKAALELGVNMVTAADRLNVLGVRVQAIFGAASKDISDFAVTTGVSLGLSQQQVLQTTANMGNALQEFGDIGKKATETISVGLVQASAQLATTQGIDLNQALRNVVLAVEGNVRSLRELQIRTDANALATTAHAHGINLTTAAMNDQEKQLLITLEVLDAAQQRTGQFAGQQKSLGQELKIAGAALTDLKNILGGALLEAVRPFIETFSSFVFILQKTGVEIKTLSEEIPHFSLAMKIAGETIGTVLTGGLLPILQGLNLLAEHFGKGKVAADKLTESIKADEQAIKDLVATQGLTESQAKSIESAFDRIGDAFLQRERAKQDAVTKTASLTLDLARKERDANTAIVRAEEDFTHTQVENRRKIVAAESSVSDAIDKAADDNKKAQQRIDDENLSHTRKVEDLSLRIKAAKEAEAKAFLDAELSLEAALRRGTSEQINAAEVKLSEAKRSGGATGALATAERDLAREQEDHVTKLKRLNEDAAQQRVDDAKAIAKAELALEHAKQDAIFNTLKAQEKVNDALQKQRDLREDAIIAEKKLSVELKRAADDAQKALDRANRDVQEIATNLGVAVTELAHLVNEFKGLPDPLFPPFQEPRTNPRGPLPPIFFAAGGDFGLDPFIAGERGPELIIPRAPGTVVNNDDLMALLKGLVGEGGSKFTIIDNTGQAEAIAEAVMARSVRNVG